MPDPTITVALLALVALIELSPIVRLPIGLVLAIALLVSGSELLPVAIIGAAGVMLARLGLAFGARAGRDRLGAASDQAQARREQLRAQLAGSPAYARITFTLSALPGVPAGFLFPLLGAMRAPLWPALVGTIVGRTPVLALTAAIFVWLGRIGDGTDEDAALSLGILAVLLIVFRSFGLVDWRHRSETGKWRLRDPDEHMVRMTTILGRSGGFPGPAAPTSSDRDDDGHVVEGELLGEEHDDDDHDDGEDPPSPTGLPPSGLAPS